MRELRPGLWHWQAPHPDWSQDEPWEPNVSSYAADDGARLLLFDPISVPAQLEELASIRETAVVLTAPWHERDARSLVERLGVPVYSPPPESAKDLMQKYGITREQAGDGSPDLAWLRAGAGEAHWYVAGDRPLAGIQAFPSRDDREVVLWLEDQRAVLAGDTLVDFGSGLEIPPVWLRKDVTRESVVAGLRPLLELPVEHVLATHGAPTDRAALERALA